MFTSITHHPFRVFFLVLIAALALTACSRKLTFQKSEVVPAAEGKVKIKKDDNNNYRIDINISNLAKPERLTPSRRYYIVWLETSRNNLKNLGQIKTESGFFTGNLKATFSTVVPQKPERIFITAEDNLREVYPGSQLILTTSTF